MEYNEHGSFLEELLALRSNPWETLNGCFDSFDDFPYSIPSNASFDEFSIPIDQSLNYPFSEFYCPFGDEFSAPEITTTDHSSNNKLDTPPFPTPDEELGLVGNGIHTMEPIQSTEVPSFNMGMSHLERKSKIKKLDGQPSKNLMAERRRRKRLNDRLSMLRSVVPKISKMDRTSILGDTIDYMKELLERIHNLQGEIGVDSNQLNLVSIFKDVDPNEVLVRNSPKFDVERRNMDTRIKICCAGKPGLLLSTVTTLEALGHEIQQCVISCFNDFAMQASCSEELEQREVMSSEDIKQALFRNAGYGGRCL
uniref:Putative Beta HLH protein 93 n=1 Tax=Davidia involucrata TaxID=16924 RepID=A0A5B7A3G8_DAVIN